MIPAPLTLDDLERLAFTYGGTIERNVATDRYVLVGALVAGQRRNFGPVAGVVRVDGTPVGSWSDDTAALAAAVRGVTG